MTTTADRPRGAQLLHRACDLLDLVGDADGEVGHADLATATGLSRATVYRILSVLIDRGLVRHRPVSGTYALGTRFLAPPSHGGGSTLLRVAEPELRWL